MQRSKRQDNRPAFQFYPKDWRTDTALQLCTLAARGLWIELLCVAFFCEERGVLKQNGSNLEAKDIARLVHTPTEVVAEYLDELETNGVFSRRDDGAIYSRRMVREAEISRKRADAGAKGGKASGKQTSSKEQAKGKQVAGVGVEEYIDDSDDSLSGLHPDTLADLQGKAFTTFGSDPVGGWLQMGFTHQQIAYAIDECLGAGKRSPQYAKGIMARLKREGITDPAAAAPEPDDEHTPLADRPVDLDELLRRQQPKTPEREED